MTSLSSSQKSDLGLILILRDESGSYKKVQSTTKIIFFATNVKGARYLLTIHEVLVARSHKD